MDIKLYRKMYATLCGAASHAVDLLSDPNGAPQAKALLEKALLSAEELYLSSSEDSAVADNNEKYTGV